MIVSTSSIFVRHLAFHLYVAVYLIDTLQALNDEICEPLNSQSYYPYPFSIDATSLCDHGSFLRGTDAHMSFFRIHSTGMVSSITVLSPRTISSTDSSIHISCHHCYSHQTHTRFHERQSLKVFLSGSYSAAVFASSSLKDLFSFPAQITFTPRTLPLR